MRVCLCCFDFRRENHGRQPWKYMYEVSSQLEALGHQVTVVTNAESDSSISLRTRRVGKRSLIDWSSADMKSVLEEENPDLIITMLGLASLVRMRFDTSRPVVGILTSPVYRIGELLSIGLRELALHSNYIVVHFIGALVPKRWIARKANSLDAIVVLSKHTRERLLQIGIQAEIIVIPPGIDEIWRKHVSTSASDDLVDDTNPDGPPLIAYFTSPLTLRGTDTLVKAFCLVRKKHRCTLLFLSRRDRLSDISDERYLMRIAGRQRVIDDIVLVSSHLEPARIQQFLRSSTIICLPFKIVLSDVPLSILEALSVGTPILSTRIGCIPELIAGRGLTVKPNSVAELTAAMERLLVDDRLRRSLSGGPIALAKRGGSWKDVGADFGILLERLVSRPSIK